MIDGALPNLRRTPAPSRPPPADDAMTATLGRVLGTSELRASDRQRRLLVYLVDETLAGRSERLKAYNIATAVLDRDERFDPQSDPTVRIEIGHLRRRLERYYLTDGRADVFRIVIPKGSYVPYLELAPTASVPSEDTTAKRHRRHLRPICTVAAIVLLLGVVSVAITGAQLSRGSDARSPDEPIFGPSLRVDGFVNANHDPGLDSFADALTAEITSALVPFKSLAVYVPGLQAESAQPVLDYRLQGSVKRLTHEVHVTVQLVDVKTGTVLWAQDYSAAPELSTGERQAIARRIAATLGDPYGELFALETKATETAARDTAAIRNCLLTFDVYVETWSRDLHRDLRRCHEAAVRLAPNYGEAWAHLALIYLDEFKYGYNPVVDAAASLDRATDAARRAVMADATNARAHLGLALTSWFKHDFASFSTEAERAVALNPSDPLVVAEVGTRRFLRGDFNGGIALVRQVLAQASGRPLRYHDVIAVDAYLKHDYTLALDEAKRADVKDRPLAQIILAAIYGKLGQGDEAAAIWDAFRKQQPQLAAAPRNTMLDRGWIPDMADALMSGIEAAGVLPSNDDRPINPGR